METVQAVTILLLILVELLFLGGLLYHPLKNLLYKMGGYVPDKSIFLYTFFLSFLGLECSPLFYRFLGGVRAASDVHLLGDSHVQHHRFPFYRDHILWKTANFQRYGFPFYSG